MAKKILTRERIYIWLLLFVVVMSVLAFLGEKSDTALKEEQARKTREVLLREEYSLTPEKIHTLMKEKREIIAVINFFIMLIMLTLVVGIILDIYLIHQVRKGKKLIEPLRGSSEVKWDLWDVSNAVIFFLFFGYVLIVVESAFAKFYPSFKEKESLRMMLNSSILDSLAVIFVLYTVSVDYKTKLRELGLSVYDFFKNVFTGITGYVAAAPLIAGSLFLIVWVSRLLNYEPPMEPALRLFLEEKNTLFLLYSTVFVTVIGPVFEEIFFRGFMYSAIRKKTGVPAAILLTSFLFSLLHTNIVGFLPIMVLGVLLAYLYEKTGSLVSPIIVHIIHNTGMLTFVFLLKELKV